MRYLPPRSGALIEWLRAELPGAAAVTAACVDVDAAGLGLLAGPIGEFLDGGGQLKVLVATMAAATVARAVLDGPNRDVVVQVTGNAWPMAAYAVTSADGVHRAYLGGTTWTLPSLLAAVPAVLFDLRRDSQAAERLLCDVTAPASADVQVPKAEALEDLLQHAMDALESVSATRSLRTGLVTLGRRGTSTGLADLDALTSGVWPGDLWVITGRTGAGKSVFVLDLARSAAIGQQVPTAVILGREDKRDAVTRLLSAEARVAVHHLRLGALTDDDWARLVRRMGEVGDRPLRMTQVGTDVRLATPEEMLAAAAETVRRHDTRLLALDSLPPENARHHLHGLKELAARERVAVLVVLADDADRAAIEEESARHADVVIRVDRDHDMQCDGEQSPRAGEADLAVLRHRRGPISVITVAFQGTTPAS
jgi:hypothetical protein